MSSDEFMFQALGLQGNQLEFIKFPKVMPIMCLVPMSSNAFSVCFGSVRMSFRTTHLSFQMNSGQF